MSCNEWHKEHEMDQTRLGEVTYKCGSCMVYHKGNCTLTVTESNQEVQEVDGS